jgi:hypothetical protein
MRRGMNNLMAVLILLTSTSLFGQDTNFEPLKDTVPRGVSVSPASVRFGLKPGTSQSKSIKIFNDTDFERTFKLVVRDYLPNDVNRKAETSNPPEDYKFGLKKWITITPSLVTLKPGERASVNLLIDIPQGDEYAHAAWTMIVVDEVSDRKELNIPSSNPNTVGMGIVPTMGFGIFLYQNPPDILNNRIEMTGYTIDAEKKNINMKASNSGDAIGFCTYYVELLNMATGESIKVQSNTATILPGATRDFNIKLPPLPSGSYNALGVLDFGSKDYVETAELDFAIP